MRSDMRCTRLELRRRMAGPSSARKPRAPHLTTPTPSSAWPTSTDNPQEQQGREFSFKPTVLGTLHRPEHTNGANGSQNGSEAYTDNGSSASGYGELQSEILNSSTVRPEHHSQRSLPPPYPGSEYPNPNHEGPHDPAMISRHELLYQHGKLRNDKRKVPWQQSPIGCNPTMSGVLLASCELNPASYLVGPHTGPSSKYHPHHPTLHGQHPGPRHGTRSAGGGGEGAAA